MMNASALVLATCENKRAKIAQQLSTTQLFTSITPLATTTSMFQHLKTHSIDLICWSVGKDEKPASWIQKLQGMEECHDLPLIAFADDQESLLDSFNLGASDAITTSISTDELRARLRGQLKRWQRLISLRQSKDQLQKMALTDPLTGLGNRATFDMSLKQAAARTMRSATPFSLLLIDLDHFKIINDRFGHQAGDNILRHVAEAIRASARDADVCCRYGGEEFAVILPDTKAQNAQVLAERIHRQIARASRKLHHHRPVTVSIGISSANQKSASNLKQIVEEADRALYLAKENGRNRTELWHSASAHQRRVEYSYPSMSQQLAFGA